MIAEKLQDSDLSTQLAESTTGTCVDTPELSLEEQGSDNQQSESEVSTSNGSKRATSTQSKNFNYVAMVVLVWKLGVQLLMN